MVERYDAFILVEAGAQEAKKLEREFPAEDITDLYAIRFADRQVDATAAPSAAPRG